MLIYRQINERVDKMSKNKSLAFPLGLLAGVVGGVIAGILFAPKPGEETRKELAEAANEFYEKHSPEINAAKRQAIQSVDLVKCKIERQFKNISDRIKSNKLRKAKVREASDYNE